MEELFEPFLPFSRYNLWSKITTDRNWHIKQNMEHDFCERNKLKSCYFPKKNVSWKSNLYKSNIHKTCIVLHFVWSNGLLLFFWLSVAFDVASSAGEKTSLINPFNNFLAGFVANKQDFCRLNKLVLFTFRLSFCNSKVFDWSWSLL